MPQPSKLSIATSAVLRLLKEEESYHKEQEQQEARIANLAKTNEGENAEFQLKQERQALEETKAIFPPLRQRIMAAAAQLEQQLTEGGESHSAEEITKGRDALDQAKALQG